MKLSILKNIHTGSSPSSFLVMGGGGSFSGVKQKGCEDDHYCHLMPRLRMSGGKVPLLLYAFMVNSGTISLLLAFLLSHPRLALDCSFHTLI